MSSNGWNLPTINMRRQESNHKQTSLKIALLEAIKKFEKESDYEFEPYEIDNIFLDMIKRNHESYISCKFGNLMI